jgi:hypothetical protein
MDSQKEKRDPYDVLSYVLVNKYYGSNFNQLK